MESNNQQLKRHNQQVKQVLAFARYEAYILNSSDIKPEHLFLGMMREDNRLGSRFLHLDGASTSSIRRQIEEFSGRGIDSSPINPPLSNECEQVFARAEDIAEEFGQKCIAIPHLLLGLLSDAKAFAAAVLLPNGFRESAVREDLVRFAEEPPCGDTSLDLMSELVSIGRRNEPGGGASWFLTRANDRARASGNW